MAFRAGRLVASHSAGLAQPRRPSLPSPAACAAALPRQRLRGAARRACAAPKGLRLAV